MKTHTHLMISVLVPLLEQATKVNITCAKSAPCETSFSVAGYIHRKERIGLSSDTFRNQLILKQFEKFLDIKKINHELVLFYSTFSCSKYKIKLNHKDIKITASIT